MWPHFFFRQLVARGGEAGVALAADGLLAVVLLGEEGKGGVVDTATKTEDKVEGRLLLDIVIGEGSAILELLTGEDETLLIRGDALLVLDLGLDVVDGVGRLDIEGDSLTREGLDENLHSCVCLFKSDLREREKDEEGGGNTVRKYRLWGIVGETVSRQKNDLRNELIIDVAPASIEGQYTMQSRPALRHHTRGVGTCACCRARPASDLQTRKLSGPLDHTTRTKTHDVPGAPTCAQESAQHLQVGEPSK